MEFRAILKDKFIGADYIYCDVKQLYSTVHVINLRFTHLAIGQVLHTLSCYVY